MKIICLCGKTEEEGKECEQCGISPREGEECDVKGCTNWHRKGTLHLDPYGEGVTEAKVREFWRKI